FMGASGVATISIRRSFISELPIFALYNMTGLRIFELDSVNLGNVKSQSLHLQMDNYQSRFTMTNCTKGPMRSLDCKTSPNKVRKAKVSGGELIEYRLPNSPLGVAGSTRKSEAHQSTCMFMFYQVNTFRSGLAK
ncbi:unnamed protein product, partial [Timema podura]|nr:unnamed protein product [Timema podura]